MIVAGAEAAFEGEVRERDPDLERESAGEGARRPLGEAAFPVGFCMAVSAITSCGFLSSRKPLNAAWRIMPEAVQPSNSISATNSGLSQRTLLSLGGASAPMKGLCSRVSF